YADAFRFEPADPFVKTCQLLADRLASDGDRFGRQETCYQPVLLRVMASNRKSSRFFTTENDLVLIYQFADKFEPYRRFVQFKSAVLCYAVDQMRRCHGPCES